MGPLDKPAIGVREEECNIMKLYRNDTYTIVDRMGCSHIGTYLLFYDSDDMARRNALGAATQGRT